MNYFIIAGLPEEERKNFLENKEVLVKDKLTISEVVNFVCNHFKTDIKKLQDKGRQRESFIVPRRVFWYLARKYSKTTKYRELGEFLGFDHATVLHAVRMFEHAKEFWKDDLGEMHREAEAKFIQTFGRN